MPSSLMAGCSKGQIGTLLAESCPERCLSAPNNVVLDGETLLASEEVRMLVTPRLNRDLMTWGSSQVRARPP